MIDHVRNFAKKARKRGLSYVGAVSAYHAHGMRYRLVAFAERFGDADAVLNEAPTPPFHFAVEDMKNIVAAIPKKVKDSVVLEATRILEQRFSFRGLPEIHFPRAIDWELAPEGNLSWSWDLNRHRLFLTLGTAYHYTQDAAYLDQLMALWHDWMRGNLPGKGQNWRSPFEVAARLRNWVWAYFLLAASPEISALFLRHAWQGLCQHAAFLADHLEYHWPNNHLLLEALSLCEFGVVFRGVGGDGYLASAFKALEEQVERQILADGVHSELCPMYHEIVASELTAFVHLCHKLDYPLPVVMKERIGTMRRFSAVMRRSDGSFPLLGDSSSPDTCLRFDFGNPGNELVHWIEPGSAQTGGNRHQPFVQAPLLLDLFADAGYGILRGKARQAHLIFDFGPWSRCSTTNHGHSDALSFEFHASGRTWIVDSGFFYPWNGDDSWNRYFRSTAAHNSLVINGAEQFEFCERGNVDRVAKTRLVSYSTGFDEVAVRGEVQPYWSNGEVVHRREIALNQRGEVAVRDSVDALAAATCRLHWYFHFAADLDVELTSANTAVVVGDGQILKCEVFSSGPVPRLRLIRGQEAPRQGWVAKSSATVVPAWVLEVETETAEPCEINFGFRFAPSFDDAQSREFCGSTSA